LSVVAAVFINTTTKFILILVCPDVIADAFAIVSYLRYDTTPKTSWGRLSTCIDIFLLFLFQLVDGD
jgi:hypothetical protein